MLNISNRDGCARSSTSASFSRSSCRDRRHTEFRPEPDGRRSRTRHLKRIAGLRDRRHDRRAWKTTDPDGREVVLTAERWSHILDRHPNIDVTAEEIVGAATRPDARTDGRERHVEWFYRHRAGPSAWIKVVVHYEGDRGLIVTAFPRRLFP